ncbi:SGNH/GDSL hydrolase family protein [Agrobacterium tumefaciens]|uniref:SGNH/GDSL hydrolase family protein n=1 Tax=Agrobacterium tumefaciens TaxID=358 RepID=UPI003BA18A93
MAAPRGSEVWRDFVTDGIPSSGNNNPKKSDARAWSSWLESLVTSGVLSSGPWFATKASMTLGYSANTIAIVYNDAVAANNGLYIKVGASGVGSWTQLTSFLPGYQFVTASPTGESTANAIVALTSPRLPSGDGVALITLAIPATNTATPVTVRFDGGAVLTIKTRTGEDPDAGELQQNDLVAGFVSGANFRLISDLNSLRNYQSAKAWANNDEDAPIPAILGGDGATTFSAKHWAAKSEEDADRSDDEADRSEVARVGAESARDQAAGYVNDIVSEKEVPITATRNGMEEVPFPDGMGDLLVLGTAAIGDAPAVHYIRSLTEPPHGGKVQSDDGKWWELNESSPTFTHFDGRAVNSAAANGVALLKAASYLAAKGLTRLRVDEDVVVSGVDKADVADVVFVGKGKITGVYRKFVIPDSAGSPDLNFAGDLVPSVHLKRLNSAKSPIIAVIGDSTTTQVFPDPGSPQDMIYSILKGKMSRDLAPRRPKFYNFAIGGTQLFQTMVAPVPAIVETMGWYNGNTMKTWLSYVQDVKPDVVFVNFGQNDGYGLSITMLQALVTTVRAWSKVPDIVFMTAASPSLKSASYSDVTHLDRDRAAGLIRSYAKYYGYGLIDIGRATTIARDGYDPLRTSILQEELSYVANPSGANIIFTAAPERGWAISSFKMRIQINPLDWVTGQAGLLILADDGQGAGFVSVFKNPSGKMRFVYNAGKSGASLPLWTVDTDFTIPTDPFYLWVDVNHGRFSARLTQNYWVDPIIDEALVGYQVLRGVVLWQLGTYAVVTNLRMFASLPKLFKPTITNNELYHDTRFGNGNGVNHMTARASTEVYSPAIEQFTYSSARQTETYRMPVAGTPANTSEVVLFSRLFEAGHMFDDDVMRLVAQFVQGGGTNAFRVVAVVGGVDVEILSSSGATGGDIIVECDMEGFTSGSTGRYAARAFRGTAVLATKRGSLSFDAATQAIAIEVRATGSGAAGTLTLDSGYLQVSS